MFLFSFGDMIAKLLTSSFHPVQIIWFRQTGLLAVVFGLLATKGFSILRTTRPVLQMSRGLLVVMSSVLFVFAVRYVALADAVAASFVAPFFLTISGALLLKEPVGIRRWSAVVIGFIGALIVVRPGMGVIHPAVMLVVVAAALYALRQVIGRLLADTDKTVTTIAYTALTASVIITIPLPFVWVTPESGLQWLQLMALGASAAMAEILIIKALELSEAALVAPIHYTLIIWGILYGYIIFNDLPDQWTLIGAAIIVAAGLYTLRRSEKKSAAGKLPAK